MGDATLKMFAPASSEHVASRGGSLGIEDCLDVAERLDVRVAVVVHTLVDGAGASLARRRGVLNVRQGDLFRECGGDPLQGVSTSYCLCCLSETSVPANLLP